MIKRNVSGLMEKESPGREKKHDRRHWSVNMLAGFERFSGAELIRLT